MALRNTYWHVSAQITFGKKINKTITRQGSTTIYTRIFKFDKRKINKKALLNIGNLMVQEYKKINPDHEVTDIRLLAVSNLGEFTEREWEEE